jgi:hypothetical protein
MPLQQYSDRTVATPAALHHLHVLVRKFDMCVQHMGHEQWAACMLLSGLSMRLAWLGRLLASQTWPL